MGGLSCFGHHLASASVFSSKAVTGSALDLVARLIQGQDYCNFLRVLGLLLR